MITLNIVLQATAPTSGVTGLGAIIPILLILIIVLIIVNYAKRNRNVTNINISTDQINKVVNVNLIGGIIGLCSSSPQIRLNNAIRKENADGWKVIQVMPSESGNIFLILLRLLLLIITLFLYTTENGYYLVMEKGSDSD